MWTNGLSQLGLERIQWVTVNCQRTSYYLENSYSKQRFSESWQTCKMEGFSKLVKTVSTVNCFLKMLYLRCLTGFWIGLCWYLVFSIIKVFTNWNKRELFVFYHIKSVSYNFYKRLYQEHLSLGWNLSTYIALNFLDRWSKIWF